MPPQQERRASKRAPCRLVCPFEVMKRVSTRTVTLTKGSGHAINRSVRGMLLLLPAHVHTRQVLEIQVSSTARKRPRTTLVEVCWTRPISVGTRVTMYLAGTQFFFALPVPS
jgi:Fe-S-cluster-containing hydrogenase component 2